MKKSLPPKSGDVHKKSRNTAHKNVPSDKKDDEDDDGTWVCHGVFIICHWVFRTENSVGLISAYGVGRVYRCV